MLCAALPSQRWLALQQKEEDVRREEAQKRRVELEALETKLTREVSMII